MRTTIPMEIGFFTASISAGIAIALLYDLLRISRRIIGPGDAIITLEDSIFMIASAFILFYAAYKKNNGEIRWQSFIGCGTGIGAYILIVRNRFMNVSVFLIKFSVRLTEKILRILFFPLRLVFMAFRKPVSIIIWYTGAKIRKARRLVRQSRNKLTLRLKNAVLLLQKK